jgi:hypothetical protein
MSQEMMLVKLTNGNIILGSVNMNSEDNVEIEKPVYLVFSQDGSGHASIRFGDFMPGSVNTFFVLKDKDVLCLGEPQHQLVELYNKVMNPSSIAVPEEGLILPS